MSLASWLQQTVSVASVSGVDAYGKASFGAARSVPARVEPKRRLVRTSTGDEAVSNHVIYTADEVKLTDRVWLPGASTASPEASNVPLAVTVSRDRTGGRTLYKVEL